eukprot:974861-Lingulodinium_polyedra.AAC.1
MVILGIQALNPDVPIAGTRRGITLALKQGADEAASPNHWLFKANGGPEVDREKHGGKQLRKGLVGRSRDTVLAKGLARVLVRVPFPKEGDWSNQPKRERLGHGTSRTLTSRAESKVLKLSK